MVSICVNVGYVFDHFPLLMLFLVGNYNYTTIYCYKVIVEIKYLLSYSKACSIML